MTHTSHLTLKPPKGFLPVQHFHGWLRVEDEAYISLLDLPVPIDQVTAGFTEPELLEKESMVFESVEDVKVARRRGRLFTHIEPGVEGVGMVKWTVAVGEGDRTALAVAGIPANLRSRHEKALRKSLLGLKWRPEKLTDPFQGLGIRVDTSGFAYQQRAGELVLLSDAPPSPGLGRHVAVGRSTSENMRIVNRERFAVKRLHANVVRVRESLEQVSIEAGGLQGYRTYATVESLDARFEDEDRLALQVVLFGATDYFVIWSECDPADSEGRALFDSVASSFVRVDEDGREITDPVPPPAAAVQHMHDAFDLALRHLDKEEDELGKLYAKAHPELDPAWARAYGAEAWFLRHNVRFLTKFLTGTMAEMVEPKLRERLPGFDDATFERAMAYSKTL